MAGGLVALLDDIAALAKLSAASVDDVAAAAGRASAKAAGVVVDDTAVTPRYVQGVDPKRELPIIKKITVGSLRNKLVFILPAALLLSQFAPWALTPLLMLGGTYLCFEGAEKVVEHFSRNQHVPEEPAPGRGADAEKQVTSGAIRTDFILSSEIMVIALNEVAHQPLVARAVILVIVGIAITVLVYGVVALIVKMDDIGLALASRESQGARRFGRALVAAMPKVLTVISVVGVFAMLWVGGHILLTGMASLGFTPVYDWVHHLGEAVHGVAGVGGALAWLVETFFAFVLGLVWGGLLVGIAHVLPFGRKHGGAGKAHEVAEPSDFGTAHAASQTSGAVDSGGATDASGAADPGGAAGTSGSSAAKGES